MHNIMSIGVIIILTVLTYVYGNNSAKATGTGTAIPEYNPLISGPYGVPDKALTASSSHYFANYFPVYGPHCARLFSKGNYKDGLVNIPGVGAWCTDTPRTGDWIQVRFDQRQAIIKVLTRGRHDHPQWVTQYKISTSDDCKTFTDYREHGKVKIFLGNKDQHTIVTNALRNPVNARCVRLTVLGYHAYSCMRFELIGKPACPVGFTTWNKSCYKMYPEKLPWSDASVVCARHGGHLVRVGSQAEHQWLVKGLLQKHSHYIAAVNKDCQGSTMSHLTLVTETQCKTFCLKVPLCKAVVIRKASRDCWWKSKCSQTDLVKSNGKTTYILSSRASEIWTDMNRLDDQKTWTNKPDVTATYFNWAPNQPHAGESCAAISPVNGYKWTSKSCSARLYFICQVSLA